MKWGEKAHWLESLAAQGQNVPALNNRPNVGPFVFYWRAFCELNSCRTWGDMPGPIPWVAIDSWANRNQCTGFRFTNLVAVIQAVDDRYLKAYYDKQKAELKKRGRSNKSRTNSY